jgi:hypothetical protein
MEGDRKNLVDHSQTVDVMLLVWRTTTMNSSTAKKTSSMNSPTAIQKEIQAVMTTTEQTVETVHVNRRLEKVGQMVDMNNHSNQHDIAQTAWILVAAGKVVVVAVVEYDDIVAVDKSDVDAVFVVVVGVVVEEIVVTDQFHLHFEVSMVAESLLDGGVHVQNTNIDRVVAAYRYESADPISMNHEQRKTL